jgi:hypothetical protein
MCMFPELHIQQQTSQLRTQEKTTKQSGFLSICKDYWSPFYVQSADIYILVYSHHRCEVSWISCY